MSLYQVYKETGKFLLHVERLMGFYKDLCHLLNWYMLFILVGAFYTPTTVVASFTVKEYQEPLKFTLPYLSKAGDNIL